MGEKIKLLYAEDNSIIRENYVEILSTKGYNVHAVKNGVEAWECYQKEKWDILLLDMDMPDMDGAEVIKLIRGSGGCVPIVVLSGLEMDNLSILDGEESADDFVSKNWSIDALITRLDKRLRDTRERVKRGEQRVFKLSSKTTYYRVSRMLHVDGETHHLKPTLGKLMWLLCLRKNEEVPSSDLCELMWRVDHSVKREEISTYVSKLRKLLKSDASIELDKGFEGNYQLMTMEEGFR